MKDFRARRWQQEDRNPMMTVFEKAGRYPDIIDLSIGDPDLKTPQKIIDLAFADAGAGHTKYTDPWGDPELREEIARFYAEEYGVALGEREIFVSTAGCVAMYLVMEAILDPGDEVLIFDPYFSAYATQVRLGGGVPVFEKEGLYEGVPAVIDKDRSSAKLAADFGADMLVILTAVEKVCVNFGKPDQAEIDTMTIAEAEEFIAQGQFAPGSMLPKVEACIEYVRAFPEGKALITSLECAAAGIEGKTGTVITA